MLIRKAFKFKLNVPNKYKNKLKQSSGSVRFIFNKALHQIKQNYDHHKEFPSYNDMAHWLVGLKSEFSFLQKIHSQVLQQKLMDLYKGLKRFFKGMSGFPRFKKKGEYATIRYPQGFKIKDNKVYLPKIGWIPFSKSREITGTPKNVTVIHHLDKWYVSIQTEEEVTQPVHSSQSIVGIDLGVRKLAVLSDGTVYPPLDTALLDSQIKQAQKNLARKIKGSNNWKKQRTVLAKLINLRRNIIHDYIHKITTEISKNHAYVILEDLKIKNMTRSAKGTIENPGKMLLQNQV